MEQGKLYAKLIINWGSVADTVIIADRGNGWLRPISRHAHHLLCRLAVSQGRGINAAKLSTEDKATIKAEIESTLGIAIRRRGAHWALVKHVDIVDQRKAVSALVQEAA